MEGARLSVGSSTETFAVIPTDADEIDRFVALHRRFFDAGRSATFAAGIGRPALTNLGRRKPRRLGATYGESAGPRASVVDLGTGGRSKRADLRVREAMTGSKSGGLVPVEFDGFAVLSVIERKGVRSRNAGCFRVGFGQCDGRIVMRPAFSVAPGLWVSDRVGRSR